MSNEGGVTCNFSSAVHAVMRSCGIRLEHEAASSWSSLISRRSCLSESELTESSFEDRSRRCRTSLESNKPKQYISRAGLAVLRRGEAVGRWAASYG